MINLIQIGNNGKEIISTNFWKSEYAKNGYVFLSINAGAFRLLIPENRIQYLREIETTKEVIVSRGPWPEANKSDAIEILFEDYTTTPFCLHITPEQVDRMPSSKDDGKNFDFWIYANSGKIKSYSCKYRVVDYIPYLHAWGK